MLLFTKLLGKDWLVISRNQHVGFFSSSTCEFEIQNRTLPELRFAFFETFDRCVYASYKAE